MWWPHKVRRMRLRPLRFKRKGLASLASVRHSRVMTTETRTCKNCRETFEAKAAGIRVRCDRCKEAFKAAAAERALARRIAPHEEARVAAKLAGYAARRAGDEAAYEVALAELRYHDECIERMRKED